VIMTSAPDGDKDCRVLFDTSKKEMLNPNQGYKKFVMKLKQRYTCTVNKEEIGMEQL